MRVGLRSLARRVLPSAVRAGVRKVLAGGAASERPIHFTGDHADWAEAEAHCAGWDQPCILARVRESAALARDGRAAFERDGVVFAHHEHRWPLLACLLQIATRRGGRLRVLDFGGSLGSTYWQCRGFLEGLSELRWCVVEQAHYFECGRREFQGSQLRFYDTPEACAADGVPDVVLLSGVLQCVPRPCEVLRRLQALGAPYVLLDRTPYLIGGHDRDRVTVQHVPPEIYGVATRYPCWFFSRRRMHEALGVGHDLAYEFDALDVPERLEGGEAAHYFGQLWRRTEEAGRPLGAPGTRRPRFRVGVVQPGRAATAGGEHTYEQDLFSALLAKMADSPHEFVLLSDRADDAPLPPNCGRLVLPAELAPGLLPSPWCARRAELLRGHDVALVVSLNPWTLVTPEVPFLTAVWDLQHRLQPHFPEVSGGQAWDGRQRHFEASLPRATWVVTGTQAGKDQVRRLFGVAAERVAVVPMPTPSDAASHRPDAQTPARLGLASPYLLYPAQFWPHKNHATLLRALKALGESHGLRPQLVLTGADHGNAGHVADLIAELGLAEQVRHLGFVGRSVLLDLYAGAAALAYPSLFGPDNLPPLEAFALGCPVVAGRIEGADEQLGDAALLVDPLDPTGWAEALRAALTDEGVRGRLIAAGRGRAAGRTSAAAAAEVLGLVDHFAVVRGLWR